jgi:hypothetical protein
MEIYKVNDDPQDFFCFVKEHIKIRYQLEIGFIYQEKEIYICSANKYILDILCLKFKLIPCRLPEIHRNWKCFGDTGSLRGNNKEEVKNESV